MAESGERGSLQDAAAWAMRLELLVVLGECILRYAISVAHAVDDNSFLSVDSRGCRTSWLLYTSDMVT